MINTELIKEAMLILGGFFAYCLVFLYVWGRGGVSEEELNVINYANQRHISEYDVFCIAGDRYTKTPARIMFDFIIYIQNSRVPTYVNDLVRG